MNMVLETLPVADSKMKLIGKKTEQDQVVQQVKQYVMNGWPDTKQNCIAEVNKFWNYKDELSVCDEILYKGNKIVIPRSLRKKMLVKIHEGLLGTEKCKKRAREVMYWPGINQDITSVVSRCHTCVKHQYSNPREPLQPQLVPERPYQKVGAEIFTCLGKKLSFGYRLLFILSLCVCVKHNYSRKCYLMHEINFCSTWSTRRSLY